MALPDAFRIWLCIKFGQEISWSVVGSLVWHPRVGGRPRVMFCYFPQGIHVCARLTSRPATILLRCPFLRASWRWFFIGAIYLQKILLIIYYIIYIILYIILYYIIYIFMWKKSQKNRTVILRYIRYLK